MELKEEIYKFHQILSLETKYQNKNNKDLVIAILLIKLMMEIIQFA